MKFCPTCKVTKSLDDFGTNKSKKDGKATSCKPCRKIINVKHYQATKHIRNPQRYANREKRTRELQQFVWNFLDENPCIDCGEADPIVLQFDHVRGIKKYNISQMLHDGYSLAKVQEELDKCVVRCANCHHRKTAKEQGWLKALR